MKITHVTTRLLMFAIALFAYKAHAQLPDTLYILDEIHPYEITGNPAVNIPLSGASSIGDVNGDGKSDLLFIRYTADERSTDLSDNIYKSVIVTDIANPDSARILYDARVCGIGDFNGDSYDDILDIDAQVIYFGDPDLKLEDSLQINFAENMKCLYYAGDITGDGKSDIIMGERYGTTQLMIYTGGNALAIPVNPGLFLLKDDPGYVSCYDYDDDGIKELALISHFEEVFWYRPDTASGEMIKEYSKSIPFDGIFSDINGDGKPEIVAVSFSEQGYDFKVSFALDQAPWFGSQQLFPAGTYSPILPAWDINNDGCSDWYTKCHKDSVMLFAGNENIDQQGFEIEKYHTGDCLMLPPNSSFYGYFNYMPPFDYDMDSTDDMLLDYYTFDNNLQYEKTGTAIIRGGENPGFSDPLLLLQDRQSAHLTLGYGSTVKNVGDINHDQYPDYAVGTHQGCYIDVFHGGPVWDDEPDMKIFLPQTGQGHIFGWDAADINGDGYTDFIISNSSHRDGWQLYENQLEYHNRVMIFFGEENMPASYNYQDADLVLEDHSTFRDFGRTVSVVGDYNADGYNDFIIGGGKHLDCLREAFLYLGGEQISDQPDMILSIYCTDCGIAFAEPIVRAADINADGYDDFILGDPDNENGLFHVYYGGPDADSLPDMTLQNPAVEYSALNQLAVSQCMDHDGDGYPDFASFSNDTIFIYKGGADFDSIPDMIYSDTSLPYSGAFLEFLPNFTTPGRADIIAGGYNSTRIIVFSAENEHHNQADLILQNDLPWATSVCSEDYDQDGYMDLLAGFPRELNYGVRLGGITRHYKSPVFTSDKEVPVRPSGAYIYPNPADEFISISLPEAGQDLRVSLYTIDGRKVLECRQQKINIHHLSKGLYFIHIKTSDLPAEVHKIVVQ